MVAIRIQLVRRTEVRRSGWDEIDAVRLLRPKGKKKAAPTRPTLILR